MIQSLYGPPEPDLSYRIISRHRREVLIPAPDQTPNAAVAQAIAAHNPDLARAVRTGNPLTFGDRHIENGHKILADQPKQVGETVTTTQEERDAARRSAWSIATPDANRLNQTRLEVLTPRRGLSR